MKICFIIGSYPKDWMGGAELQSYLLARGFAKRGHETHYFAINTRRGKIGSEEDDGILVHRFRRSAHKFSYYRDIIRLFDKIHPHICYSRSRGELPISYFLARRHNIPLIYALASDSFCIPITFPINIWRPRAFLHRMKQWLSQMFVRKADVIIVQSEHQQQLLLKNYGLRSALVRKAIPIPKQSQIEEKSDPPLVLWLANIKPVKRPEIFIDLAGECKDLPSRFWMVGRLPDDGNYSSMIRDAVRIPNFKYLGQVSYDDANRLMNQAALFISTSMTEGFPANTFLQAWMHQVPIVSFSKTRLEVIEKEDLGVCPESFARLVQVVQGLILDRSRREQLGRSARDYVERNHDIDKMVDKHEGIFKRLIS